MYYVILGTIIIVALFLIFRDDHDKSYNKSEKGYIQEPKTEQKAEPKTSGPLLKDADEPMKIFGEVIGMVKDEQFQDEGDLSFLDELDYSEDLEENTETFDIAGLKYRCTKEDCGTIVGVVKPEPSNSHDSRAQAVFRNDGKRLGYIPRTQLDWYEDFNELNVPCPFVGEIELDEDGRLTAEIKVIIPTNREYVEEEIENGL